MTTAKSKPKDKAQASSEKPSRRPSLGPPVHLPFSVDYAPTSRAKCKKCGSIIQKDAPRFCRKVNSPWHDGVDIQVNHLECGTKWVKDLASIHYLGWLTWDDFLKAADTWEVEVSLSDPAVKNTRNLLKAVAAVREAVTAIDVQPFFGDLMRHNGLPVVAVEKFKGPVHAQIIADSLLRGLAPPCPICQRNSLIGAGESLYCSSQCDFYIAWGPVAKAKSPYDSILSKEALEGLKKRTREYRILTKAQSLKWDSVTVVMKEMAKLYPRLGFRTEIIFNDTPYEDEEGSKEESKKGVKIEREVEERSSPVRAKIKNASPLLQIDSDYQERVTPGGPRRSCIYVDNKNNAYSVYLTLSDVFSGKNSFYTIQLILSYLPISESRMKRKLKGSLRPSHHSSGRKKQKHEDAEVASESKTIHHDTNDGGESSGEDDDAVPTYIDNSKYSDSVWARRLEIKAAKFHILKKWGRLGGVVEDRGNGCTIDTFNDDLEQALKAFHSKYKELAGLPFQSRYKKQKDIPGKYRFTDLAGHHSEDSPSPLSTKKKKSDPSARNNKPQVDANCTLSPEVQELLGVIFNDQTLRESLKELDIDLRKMDLESLSSRQLTAGYSILRDLECLIHQLKQTQNDNKLELSRINHKIKLATSDFYTIVPRAFKRDEVPPPIDSINQIKTECALLENLIELATSVEVIKTTDLAEEQHPDVSWYDTVYTSIPMDISAEKKSSHVYQLVKGLLKTGHAITHSAFELSICGVYSLAPKDRKADGARGALFRKLSNKRLLWHGSRLSNWAGILTKGLRIAPPEAPTSGYMFDKGVYFADMVSKSAQYLGASPAHPRGFLLLCEVALGDQYLQLQANGTASEALLKLEMHSTQGVGRTAPNRLESKHIKSYFADPDATGVQDTFYVNKPNELDSVEVLCGKQIDNSEQIKVALSAENGTKQEPALFYNEYVVYDTAQTIPRFLVEVEFTYKMIGHDDSSSDAGESGDGDDDDDDTGDNDDV